MADAAFDYSEPVWTGHDGGAGGGLWHEYTWMVVMGCLLAFAMAWAIGANDVANSFGTSVGAKTLTLWQACIVAAIFEFSGAVALGGEVTRTVAGAITLPSYFEDKPDVFAFGMLCALLAAAFWVTLATYLELAVSTTHSIIGAIMGFGLVYGGGSAIQWARRIDTFPYIQGFVPVVVSWFTSPFLAGLAGGLLFFLNRTLILRSSNAHDRAFWALPPLVLITIFFNVFLVLYKGSVNGDWSVNQELWISAIIAGGAALLTVPFIFLAKARHRDQQSRVLSAPEQMPELAMDSKDWAPPEPPSTLWGRTKAALLYSLTVNVHEDVWKDSRVAAMHSAAEVFDPRAEEVYKYLQVFSSCCVSFAHGANDVANSIGPFAAIWYVYQNHSISSSVPVPKWILVVGGAGLVIGLATYGYNIIKVLGVKMAKMTPSRGYCAELATSLVVALASAYGLPVSTTHSIVGAEVGVGMLEGVRGGVHWRLFLKTAVAWVFTLAVAGFVSAAVFAFGINTPSLRVLDTAETYQHLMTDSAMRMARQLNATNFGNAATLGRFDRPLNDTLAATLANLTLVADGGPVNRALLAPVYNYTVAMYMSLVVPTVGFLRNLTSNTSAAIVVPGQ